MKHISHSELVDILTTRLAEAGVTFSPDDLPTLVRADLIHRAPSSLKQGSCGAVWEEPSDAVLQNVRVYLVGHRALVGDRFPTERFQAALLESHSLGRFSGTFNPVGWSGGVSLGKLEVELLRERSLPHLRSVWESHAKALSKPAPVGTGFTGHRSFANAAAIHLGYGTLVFGTDGAVLGARIFPIRRDETAPLSSDNIMWTHVDPRAAEVRLKGGRKTGTRLSPEQKALYAARLKATRQRKAAEFRAKWAADPALQASLPADKLPPSLHPDFGKAPIPRRRGRPAKKTPDYILQRSENQIEQSQSPVV